MADRLMETFDVSVLGPPAESKIWLSINSAQGSLFGLPRPKPDWDDSAGVGDTEGWLKTAVWHANPDQSKKAILVGRVLKELVFGHPDVSSLFIQARGAAAAAGAQLMIRILAAPRALATWPWELIEDPQRPDTFLAMARDAHIVRKGRTRTYAVRPAKIEPPLSLLMVMSSPLICGGADEQFAPFDLYAEKRSLLRELQPLVDRGLLQVEVEDRPTVERLRSRIGRKRGGFHLLHYLGHAQQSGLRLEASDGRAYPIDSSRFAQLLQQMPDLRLVVLAGCETARPTKQDGEDTSWPPGELSAADYCVRDACPMVVGMQAVLPFDTERLFTRFFYQAVTGGQSVAEALRLARLAIKDNEFTGGDLVNWAVPSLFVGENLPGPVADPQAVAKPVVRRYATGSRVGIRQSELRFISRLSELRVIVDYLSGRDSARLLQVTGSPGAGKTALMDRAVEELESDVTFLLATASSLLEAGRDTPAESPSDPVEELCKRVFEVLKRSGHAPPPRRGLTPLRWWGAILDGLNDKRLALVIDDGNQLGEGSARTDELIKALVQVTDRRSLARLAIVSDNPIVQLNGHLRSDQLRRIELQDLKWVEVWPWIQRNLPVLNRYPEAELSSFYADLPYLENWEELAKTLSSSNAPIDTVDLPGYVSQVARKLGSSGTAPQSVPIFGAATTPDPGIRRALNVAVALPLKKPVEDHDTGEFGRALTRIAAVHGVSGRIAVTAGKASSLAELMPLESPFDENGHTDSKRMADWLAGAKDGGANLVILGIGASKRQPGLETLIESLSAAGTLVVIAAGSKQGISPLAANRLVLSVGAMASGPGARVYPAYSTESQKPDIYAPDGLTSSTMPDMLNLSPDSRGTGIAAFYVGAAALAVWATDRHLSAEEVRWKLLESATAVSDPSGRIRELNPEMAISSARRQLVLDALQWGPLDLGQIVAQTGLTSAVIDPLLKLMLDDGTLRRPRERSTEAYEYAGSLAAQYRQLGTFIRAADWPGVQAQYASVVRTIESLGSRTGYSSTRVDSLWKGDAPQRLAALAIMHGIPSLRDDEKIKKAVAEPHSDIEHKIATELSQSVGN